MRDISTLERALLTKVAEEGNFRYLVDRQMTNRHFTDETVIAAFEAMRHHYFKKEAQGSTMSLEMLHIQVPAFDPVKLDDAVPSLCAVVEEEHYRKMVSDLAMEISDVAASSQDPRVVLDVLKRRMPKLQDAVPEAQRDCIISESIMDILEDYQGIKSQDAMLGIPFPWPALNSETMGMQPGQVFLFYARPKNMKTFLALKVATDAYKVHRKRVLFVTKEMSIKEIRTRAAALLAEVPFQGVRKGTLSEEHEEIFIDTVLHLKLLDIAKEDEDRHPYLLICSTDPKLGLTGIEAKIEEYEPDLVVIDGIYFFVNSSGRQQRWEATTDLTLATKELAQNRNIPLLITMKANREGETNMGKNTAEIAHSDSFGYDVDYAFRIVKTDHMPVLDPEGNVLRRRTELCLICPASRDSMLDAIAVAFEPATDFEEIGPITRKQVLQRVKIAEAQEEEMQKNKERGRRTTEMANDNKRSKKRTDQGIRRTLKRYKPKGP
jgi:replicative DNA helicase